MATKLTSSLRKSISAEKETVEQKTAPATKKVVKKPATTPKTVAKPAVEKPKPTVVENLQEPVAQPRAVKPPQIEAQPITQFKAFTAPNFNFAANLNSENASKLVNSIATSNQQIIDSALQTIQAVNQDLTNYLYEIVDPKNLANVANLNSELLTKLRLRQESFWQNSLEIFNQITKFK